MCVYTHTHTHIHTHVCKIIRTNTHTYVIHIALNIQKFIFSRKLRIKESVKK